MKTVKKYLSLILTLALTFLSANSLIQPVYAAGSTGPNGEFIPAGYELATDDDFEVFSPGGLKRYRYKGTKPYVVIPHKIRGEELQGHDYYGMFEHNKIIRGVAGNNPRVTDMSFMFFECESPSLDLQYLDTSNVVYMSYTFAGCKATTINLSNFDTSKVTCMRSMFRYSKAKTLNLDHFDCSSLINADDMFYNAEATSISFKSFNVMPHDEFVAKVREREAQNKRSIPYWQASSPYMYYGTKITSIDISDLRIDDYDYKGRTVAFTTDGRHPKFSLVGIIFKSNIRTIYVGNEEVKNLIEAELKDFAEYDYEGHEIPAGLKVVIK